ncbi:MAG: hypothetical protein SWY16_06215 [Cyanobacteriota bacterium]|nr:hypothetical protein [Cyanobacteriota bacterium]
MKPISLDRYLSANNPWTRRILGIEPFSKKRDLEQVEREYNQDKYGPLLEFEFDDIEQYVSKGYELSGVREDSPTTVSFGDEIFETDLKIVRSIYYSLLSSTIAKYKPQRICELGCGFGYNLAYLKQICSEVYGGEYSKNAVKLGSRLGLDLQVFNYYDLDSYQMIREGSLVLTVHSIEQIPSADSFVRGLEQHRDKIDLAINFEPCVLSDRHSLLGLFRNRYMELNDYNRDLAQTLHERDDIEILEYKPDIMGLNPLNSTHLFVWKFK